MDSLKINNPYLLGPYAANRQNARSANASQATADDADTPPVIGTPKPEADNDEGCDRVRISCKQAGGRQPEQERNMPINGISVSEYYANQVGRKHGRHGGGKADAASFDECCKAASVEPGSEQQAAEQAPTQASGEISFNDPWPPDHPFRKECDEFLELFQKTFKEVLDEKGLSPKEGEPLALSESEMEDVRQAVANKLSYDRHTVQLMTLLQVDLSSGDISTGSKKTAEQIRSEVDPMTYMTGGRFTATGSDDHNYLSEVFEMNVYEALGPEAYKEYMEMVNSDSPHIPGLNEYAMGFGQATGSTSFCLGDNFKYWLLVDRIHNEVVEELGLDPATVREGSPEASQALRMIGERIMADPEGRQLMSSLGMTAINRWGMPTRPGADDQSEPNPMFDADGNLLEAESSETDESKTETADTEPNTVHWRDLMASALAEQLATSLRSAETADAKPNAAHGRGSMASVLDEQLATMSFRLRGLTSLDQLQA
jgi:hypothetical protein